MEAFTNEQFEQTAKLYFTQDLTEFKFTNSDFMCSLRQQYLNPNKNGLSEKQKLAFMNHIHKYTVNAIVSNPEFMMNFGDIIGKRMVSVGTISHVEKVMIAGYGYRATEKEALEVSIDCGENVLCHTTTSSMNVMNAHIKVGSKVDFSGTVKRISNRGLLMSHLKIDKIF